MLAVVLNKSHLIDFDTAEPTSAFENGGIEPKLRDLVLAPHVNVRRFASIERHEEEPVSADAKGPWAFPSPFYPVIEEPGC
jgi:hypothetical protein